MLLFPLLLLLQAPPLQAACPDLTGRYAIQGEDGRVFISIAQTLCERVRIQWTVVLYGDTTSTTHDLVIDNMFRSDAAWFGEPGRQLTSASYQANQLVLIAKAPNAPEGPVRWKQLFQLLPSRDLCIVMEDSLVPSATIAGRIADDTRGAEADAARRSSFQKTCAESKYP